ncbi:hypothetical protein PsYK624_068120 [Phanerochaete sordida]|uniref:BTB domain-containing protein n=1 Tax=Phanerochaete sordida TaxID=48140 RepID=A0A9P3G9A9_9APHY|nr:hypothetical protein PsYK624_068120 [Phanerochaete sordida]
MRIATTKLDGADADIVLRSSDGQDFPMHKLDLLRSSVVFKPLLSLAHLEENTILGSHSASRQPLVIQLAEPGDVVEMLLRCCLPGGPPPIPDLSTAIRVLQCNSKYQIAFARKAACGTLERLATEEPVKVYAIACYHGLEQIARKAALACLRLPPSHFTNSRLEELRGISAAEYCRLIKYRKDCRDVAVSSPYLTTNPTISPLYLPVVPGAVRHSCWTCSCTTSTSSPISLRGLPRWWREYTYALTLSLRDCTSPEAIDTQRAVDAFLRSGACKECCAVATSQIFLTTAQLRVDITLAINQITLEFEICSGVRSPPLSTAVVRLGRCDLHCLPNRGAKAFLWAFLILLIFYLGMLAQQRITASIATASFKGSSHPPTLTRSAPNAATSYPRGRLSEWETTCR